MQIIHAGHVTLEPQVAAHAEAMFAVLSDPAIYTYDNEPPESVEWLRARFAKLESRRSGDGSEQWLNWVIRVAPDTLAGYVQATVHADGSAGVAYELASAHWGKGLGARATTAMIGELVRHYNVTKLFGVAKAANFRSIRLLERLGFVPAGSDGHPAHDVEPDEVLMSLAVRQAPDTSC